jgi:arylsulfatase
VDLVPTLLQVLKLEPPATVQGVTQMPIEGESFAASLHDAAAPPRRSPQYFEMFGHRGLWHGGWKAVAFHPPGTPFEADRWELFHLERDFSETEDLAAREPGRLKALVDLWWQQAQAHQVLPLDDRFGPRFVESARRYHGPRRHFVFHAGVGHIPSDVAPDVRGRGYLIEAEVFIDKPDAQGVLIAHGDATSGYSLFVRNGRLVHDMNIGGQHHVVESDRPVPRGHVTLGFELNVGPLLPVPPPPAPMHAMVPAWRSGTLLIDGQAAGSVRSQAGFNNFVSWSGLDIGRDRSSPVSTLYDAPFEFTGRLVRVTVTLDVPHGLDGDAVGHAEMARQ